VSRRYTAQEQANALVRLHSNGDDIPLTARQLGIPERTLYTWFRRWQEENQRQNSSLLLPPINRPDFEDDLDTLFISDNRLWANCNMAESFRTDSSLPLRLSA
jgi:hypothetical protein